MYDSSFSRQIDTEVAEEQEAVMEGVEHLGQYVYEMTKAKVEALKIGGGQLPPTDGDVDMVTAPGDEDDEPDRPENVIAQDEGVYSDKDSAEDDMAEGDGKP